MSRFLRILAYNTQMEKGNSILKEIEEADQKWEEFFNELSFELTPEQEQEFREKFMPPNKL